MREIKFRAWIERNKEMITPYFFVNSENFITQYGSSKPSQVMQFTGLKDINGVEIYEGDIVKSHFYGEDYNDIAKIEYDNSSAAFVYDSTEQDAFVYGAENGQLEVVGNIYENPELLG